ncbi:MAG TPA: universal stress protein, partial [Actinomycetota bacterium]
MKVLLGVDGEEAADHARRLVARFASRDAVEVVVCAVATFDMALREASYSGHYAAEDAGRAAETIAGEAEEELREDGFRTGVTTPRGDPAAELLREAAARHSDLIVLGTGRESRLESIVLGSTSSAVLQAAPCPVLIVHELHEHDGRARALVATDGSEDALRAADVFIAFADPDRCEATVAAIARPVGLP